MSALGATPDAPESGLVTAAIAHYGPVGRTLELVKDLLVQRDCAVQVIVADDASPEHFPRTPGVELVRREANGGFGAAINSAAMRARGEWLLILNNDVRLAPDFLASALERARAWQPAICGFRQVTSSGAVPPSGPFPTFWRTLAQRSDALHPLARRLGWTRYWQLDDPWRRDERVVDWIGGAALLLPLKDFRAVGGFDTRFFMYHEEIDLQRRLQASGVRSVVLGGLAVLHEGGATTTAIDVEGERLRSRFLYEELVHGRRQRRALEVGLRAVLAIDSVFHRGRLILRRDPVDEIRISQRREALTRARQAKKEAHP